MKVKAFGLLMGLMTVSFVLGAVPVQAKPSPTWVRPVFLKAGTIRVKDPMLVMAGLARDGDNVIGLSLVDVAKYTGHVCPGIASGFLITKAALKKLYPRGLPVRGQIKVTASKPNDILDVASYITGARAFYGREEINRNDLKVDPSLSHKKGECVIVFERKDNHKRIKVVFSRKKMLSGVKDKKGLMRLKARVEKGVAGPKEKQRLAVMMQRMVDQILEGRVVPFVVQEF